MKILKILDFISYVIALVLFVVNYCRFSMHDDLHAGIMAVLFLILLVYERLRDGK